MPVAMLLVPVPSRSMKMRTWVSFVIRSVSADRPMSILSLVMSFNSPHTNRPPARPEKWPMIHSKGGLIKPFCQTSRWSLIFANHLSKPSLALGTVKICESPQQNRRLIDVYYLVTNNNYNKSWWQVKPQILRPTPHTMPPVFPVE